METKFLAMIAVIFTVLAISLVFAAPDENANANNPNAATSGTNASSQSDTNQKNMTYGLCVAEFTKVKNSCFETAKNALKTCRTDADSAKKKQCNSDYKKSTEQCKKDFKESKKTCTKYKKTFSDKVKFWQ
jgi:hypothetical protein